MRFLLHVLSGAQALIFLPLIARTFGEAGYGVWTQISLTAALVHPLATLQLGRSVVRYLEAIPSGHGRSEAYYSTAWTVWGTGAAFIALALLLRRAIGAALFGAPALDAYVLLLAVLIAVNASLSISLAYFRSLGKLRLVTAIQAAATLGTIGVVTTTVLGFGGGLHAGGAAWVASRAVAALVAQAAVSREAGFCAPRWSGKLGMFLRYSLPLIPASAAAWILEYSDRYVIVHMLDLERAGVYAGSCQLARLMRVMMMPLSFVLLPTMIRLWNGGARDQALGLMRVSLAGYAAFAGLGVGFLVALGPTLLRVLGTPAFQQPGGLLALLVFGQLFVALCLLFSLILYLHERTQTVMAVAFVAAALNIGLNLLLIPRWGILGAAVATFLSFAAQLTATILAIGRYHCVSIPTRPLLRILLATVALYGVLSLSRLRGLAWTIAGIVGGGAIYVGVLLSSREVRAAMRRFLRSGGEEWVEGPSGPFAD